MIYQPEQPPICKVLLNDFSEAVSLVGQLSKLNQPIWIAEYIAKFPSNGVITWLTLKSVRLCPESPHVSKLLYRTLCYDGSVYSNRDLYDSVLFKSGDDTKVGLIEAVFVYYKPVFLGK